MIQKFLVFLIMCFIFTIEIFAAPNNRPNGVTNIDLNFMRKDHGNGYPFDEAGDVLAHALKEYVHFDDEETWKAAPDSEGTSLFKVAIHEIGHSLGLGDSNQGKANMFFDHFDDSEDQFKLHDDDILGIQEIYGKNKLSDVDQYDNFEDNILDFSKTFFPTKKLQNI